MNHLLFFPFFLLSLLADPSTNSRISDPASAYCHFMGYREVTRKDAKGAQYCVCIFPDGSECEAWQFFRGICGEEHSYCAKKGCETYSITEDKGTYRIISCACGCIDSLGNKKTIPLDQFMKQHGDTLIKPERKGYPY
jgi:putative hemolysin